MTINLSKHAGGGSTKYLDSKLGEALFNKCIFYNDGKDTRDRSGNLEDGVATDVTSVAMQVDNGHLFNGSTSEIRYTGNDALDNDGTKKMSWAFWIVRKNANNESIISHGANTAHTGIGWTVMTASGNTIYLQINAASGYPTDELQCNAAVSTQDGVTKEFFVITYAGTKAVSGVKFYKDGTLLSTSTGADNLTGSASNPTADLVLGACATSNAQANLDEVAIFNDELSQKEVDYLYATGLGATVTEIPQLGLPTVGDATENDILVGKTAWVNGLPILGAAVGGPGDLMLYDSFAKPSGQVAGASPDFCYDPDVTWQCSDTTVTFNGSGYAVEAASGARGFSLRPAFASRSGRVRRYLMWGRYVASPPYGDYMPKIFINIDSGWFWCVRMSTPVANYIRVSQFQWNGSTVTQSGNGASNAIVAGAARWNFLVEDYGDLVKGSISFDIESYATSSRSETLPSTYQMYRSNREYTDAAGFDILWEGTRQQCQYGGIMIWDNDV